MIYNNLPIIQFETWKRKVLDTFFESFLILHHFFSTNTICIFLDKKESKFVISSKKKTEYNERGEGKEKERYSHAIIVDAPAFNVTLLRCGTRAEKRKNERKVIRGIVLYSPTLRFAQEVHAFHLLIPSLWIIVFPVACRYGGTEQKRSDHSRFIWSQVKRIDIETNASSKDWTIG